MVNGKQNDSKLNRILSFDDNNNSITIRNKDEIWNIYFDIEEENLKYNTKIGDFYEQNKAIINDFIKNNNIKVDDFFIHVALNKAVLDVFQNKNKLVGKTNNKDKEEAQLKFALKKEFFSHER